jgi:alkylation response protein AidB-like acyl-CoA dehydrogenase
MEGAWQPIGRPHGDVACFSLHPRKVVTVGDGGVLTARDRELDARFRLLRQHGMSVPDTVRHGSPQVIFEDCRVPHENVLGELGRGYAPMQLRLNVRRMQMGARCVGMARRALEMMADQAQNRVTWGVRLADRQAIQWFAADAVMEMHACRLMVEDLARKLDAGADVRTEASILKVRATEMAQQVLDNAMQTFGAMGVTKELPLQLMHQQVRLMRVYEGPSEVHRSAIGRRALGGKV